MIRLRVLLMFLIMMIALAGRAQENGVPESPPDVLYLKDGTVLKGKLLHYIQGDKIVFELSTGDRVEYPQKKIRRFVQGGTLPEKAQAKPPKSYNFQETGLFFNLLPGMTFGRSSNSDNAVSLNLLGSAGYQLNRWIGVGGGIAVDAYVPHRGEIVYPVFAEARGYFSPTRYSGFYVLRTGYGIVFAEEDNGVMDASGGFFLNPAIGLRWGGASSVNFVSEFGFQYQRAGYERSFGWNGERDVIKKGYKRLNIRLGILF